jgi:uncharacterized membrane protein YozB (DUF420 family)
MDPKLFFWTGALALMGAVVLVAIAGVRRRRAGDIQGHRRAMLAACALVGLFLLAYVSKVTWLGHEHTAQWSAGDRLVLYVHELCIALMFAAGALAYSRARRLRVTRNATGSPADPVAPAALARWHRGAGWAAVIAAAAGWLTALLVLAGMYRRAGML